MTKLGIIASLEMIGTRETYDTAFILKDIYYKVSIIEDAFVVIKEIYVKETNLSSLYKKLNVRVDSASKISSLVCNLETNITQLLEDNTSDYSNVREEANNLSILTTNVIKTLCKLTYELPTDSIYKTKLQNILGRNQTILQKLLFMFKLY